MLSLIKNFLPVIILAGLAVIETNRDNGTGVCVSIGVIAILGKLLDIERKIA